MTTNGNNILDSRTFQLVFGLLFLSAEGVKVRANGPGMGARIHS